MLKDLFQSVGVFDIDEDHFSVRLFLMRFCVLETFWSVFARVRSLRGSSILFYLNVCEGLGRDATSAR